MNYASDALQLITQYVSKLSPGGGGNATKFINKREERRKLNWVKL